MQRGVRPGGRCGRPLRLDPRHGAEPGAVAERKVLTASVRTGTPLPPASRPSISENRSGDALAGTGTTDSDGATRHSGRRPIRGPGRWRQSATTLMPGPPGADGSSGVRGFSRPSWRSRPGPGSGCQRPSARRRCRRPGSGGPPVANGTGHRHDGAAIHRLLKIQG